MNAIKAIISATESSHSSTGEKMFLLRRIELFSTLRNAELYHLANLMDTLNLDTNQRLIQEGDLDRDVYFLRSGSMRVEMNGQQIEILNAGAIIGEMSAVDALPRSASITSMEPSSVYRLNAKHFLALLEERPDFALGIIEVLCSRLRKRHIVL